MTIAIFPGTFDPITWGHIDLIQRTSRLFDKVIVAVGINQAKTCLFTPEERIHLAQVSIQGISNVTVQPFSGLLVDFAKTVSAQVIVRGLRAAQDFEYELQMTQMNHHLAPDIDTIYLSPPAHLSFVASSIVREVASYHGNIDALVPPAVRDALQQQYGKK